MTGQYLDHAVNAIAEPPAALRPERAERLAGPDGLGQQPERGRRVGERASPSLAQSRRRPPDAVEHPDLRCYLLVPDDLLLADDDPDVGTRLVQQRSGLQRGLPAA